MTNIVSLSDVKSHLNWPNPTQPTSQDMALQRFLDAADEVIRFECEEIIPKTYSEMYDGGDFTIHLRHIPLLRVINVQEGWGWVNYDLDYVEVNSPPPFSIWAYSIDNYDNGQISRRTAGNVPIPFRSGSANIIVQYTAGLAPIPANIQLAELELIAHWWQNSQIRSAVVGGANVSYDVTAGTGYTRDTERGDQNINVGVPFRILELIKTHRHRPIIA